MCKATLANLKEAKRAELGARTVMQLKAQCAQHGLRKTGTKAELVARLCDELCTAEPLDVAQVD
jgi:hypothetical protein